MAIQKQGPLPYDASVISTAWFEEHATTSKIEISFACGCPFLGFPHPKGNINVVIRKNVNKSHKYIVTVQHRNRLYRLEQKELDAVKIFDKMLLASAYKTCRFPLSGPEGRTTKLW